MASKKTRKNFRKISKKILNLTPVSLSILLIAFLILVSYSPHYKKAEVNNKSATPPKTIAVDRQKLLQELMGKELQTGKNAEIEADVPAAENKEINSEEKSGGAETAIETGENENTEEAEESAEISAGQSAAGAAETKIPREDLVIGIAADAHAGQKNGWSRLNSFAWRMADYEYPDVVVDLGDFIESRKGYKSISKKEAEADYKNARRIISRFLLYDAIGNHELLSMSKNNIQSITGRRNYYAVNVKGYHIVVLDANYTKDEKTIDAANADDFIYTGTIPDKERKWLEDELDNQDKNIIFVHHPLYNLTNKDSIEDVIKDNKKRIILIANGHRHPSSLEKRYFGGVKNYDIPSLRFQKMYAVIKINGKTAEVISRRL